MVECADRIALVVAYSLGAFTNARIAAFTAAGSSGHVTISSTRSGNSRSKSAKKHAKDFKLDS